MFWFLSGFCLLLVSVSPAFCHILALLFPSYAFVFMFTFNLSEHSPCLSVSRFGYFRVWRSFSKSSFPTRFLILAANSFT